VVVQDKSDNSCHKGSRAKRETEAAERKKRKLEKLCTEPRHEFKDQRYEQERVELSKRVGDAVEEGFKAAGPSGIKRKQEEDFKPNKRRTILDLDIDSDEFESSDFTDDSENDDTEHDSLFVKASEGETSKEKLNDNGHTSNDENIAKVENKSSELPTNNQTDDQVSNNELTDTKIVSTKNLEDQPTN